MSKVKGMTNALFPGCSSIQKPITKREGTEIYTPIDSDHSIVAKIISYSEETGILECAPVWDSSQTVTLFAEAKFQGKEGFPLEENVEIGTFCALHRVGDFNTNPATAPSGFEVREKSADKVSWVSFFFDVGCEPIPINAIVKGPVSLEKNTLITGNVCNTFGFEGPFFELPGFEVANGSIRVFSIGGIRADSLDGTPVIIDESVNVLGNIQARIDCDTLDDSAKYYPVQLGFANIDGSLVYLIVAQGDLDLEAICCEEEDPGGEDPGGGGEDPGGEDTGGEDPGGEGEDPGGEDPDEEEDPGGGGPAPISCPATASVRVIDSEGEVLSSFTLPLKTLPNQNPPPPSCNYSARNTENPNIIGVLSSIGSGEFNARSEFSLTLKAKLLNPGGGGQFNIGKDHRGTYIVTDKPPFGELANAAIVEVS